MIRVLNIIGTRPEVIKMAPVIEELKKRPSVFQSYTILTGQHKEMCLPYLDLFSIVPDSDLSIMEKNQTLDTIVINILRTMPKIIKEYSPDYILVQGDTTSAFAAALAAYHSKVKVGHVEAGLRTGNKYNPYPEEMNRMLIGSLADLHFAPTGHAKENLLAQGVPKERIFVTGNTVIDTLKMVVKKQYRFDDETLDRIDFESRRVICVTTHRRESIGEPLQNTLAALKAIVGLYPDVEIVLPVHYNPNVRTVISETLGNVERVHLIEPLTYEPFVQLLNKSYMILTDSGGIQEEAPSLGKPVLVLRDTTERPEGVEAGTSRLVGTDTERIVSETRKLLDDRASYEKMARSVNPYGDGTSARKIADIIQNFQG